MIVRLYDGVNMKASLIDVASFDQASAISVEIIQTTVLFNQYSNNMINKLSPANNLNQKVTYRTKHKYYAELKKDYKL